VKSFPLIKAAHNGFPQLLVHSADDNAATWPIRGNDSTRKVIIVMTITIWPCLK